MGGNTLSRMVFGQQMLDRIDATNPNTQFVSRRTGRPVPRPDHLGGPRPFDPPPRNGQMQPAMGFAGPPHMMGGGMPPGMGSRASRMSGAAMGAAGMGPPPLPGFGNMATNGTIGGLGLGMHGAGGMGPPGAGGHRPTASTRASGMSTHASRASRASRASGHGGGGPGGGPHGPPGGPHGGAGGQRQRRDRYATDG
ncbi:MAG: hypothetical protein Q9199_001695 [Rusavskia elegans]